MDNWPITHHFARALGLLPDSFVLPHKKTKKETDGRDVLVSLVEELVIATIEDLADSLEGTYHQGDIPLPIREQPNYNNNLNGEGEDY